MAQGSSPPADPPARRGRPATGDAARRLGVTLGRREELGSTPLFGFLVAVGLWAFDDAIRIAASTAAVLL